MNEILELRLTDEQRVTMAPVLKLQHELLLAKRQVGIFWGLTDSYIEVERRGILRLQIGLLPWKDAKKVFAAIRKYAQPVDLQYFK